MLLFGVSGAALSGSSCTETSGSTLTVHQEDAGDLTKDSIGVERRFAHLRRRFSVEVSWMDKMLQTSIQQHLMVLFLQLLQVKNLL